jgi:glyoxylase-like metal-dependent hydrolase (beta-lactamase superfamily II)
MNEVTLRELTPAIWLAERPLDAAMTVCAAIILGEAVSAVVDTLIRPADMAPVRDMLERHGRPTLVVNTHADWDHAWGNAAFPDPPIIAHRLCRAEMLTKGQRRLTEKQAEEPERFRDVTIVPPTITFTEFMDIDLGGLTLSVHHLPGHTVDEAVVHLPEAGFLLAGDAAEWPIPTTTEGPLGPWAAALRGWAARDDVRTVVPSHGTISDTRLLLDNASYLDALLADPDAHWEPPGIMPFYAEAHRTNATVARRERAMTGHRDR